MAGTATSTLILAVQARNETAAAFGEIRAQLAEQVTAAREASLQQQTAVKAAAEQQLLAVKDALAQQVLAQRQAMEQQVAAIRAGADQQIAAQKAAYGAAGASQALIDQMTAGVRAGADAQALAVKQGYEQQTLAARTSAEQQALAIKAGLATDLDALRAGLAQQIDAQKAASAEQMAAVRAQAAEEAAALRAEAAEARTAAREGAEGGMLGRVPLVGGALVGTRERLEKPLEMGMEFLGISAGLAAISAVTEGIHELPKAFTEAATQGEAFQVQMVNFYGTMDNAGKVLEYTNQQAGKMPFSLQSIRGAVAGLAETGQNVQQLLPALGNIASAMHADLPLAVAAFNRALLTGNMRALVSQLHLSKAELEEFGMAVDKHGKIISSTLAPALERLAETKFGGAMLREAQTAQGGLQILGNQWELFKEVAGEGLFAGLKNTLATITTWLDTHQAAVQQFAQGVGRALASAASAAVSFAATFGPPILGAISLVVGAWQAAQPAIAAVVTFLNQTAQQIGTFLQTTVLPVIFAALAAASGWWQAHAAAVAQVAQTIFQTLQVFWGSLGTNMAAAFDILHGIWMAGWGLISGGFGLALDLMTGNWRQFGLDLDNMATNIAVGLLEIFHGLFSKLVDLFARIPNPLDAILQKLNQPFLLNLLRMEGHPGLAAAIQVAAAASTIGHSGHLTSAQFDQQVKAAGDAAVAARGGQDLTPDQLDHIRIVAESAASKRLLPLLNAPAGTTNATQAALDAYFTAQEDDLRRKANLLTGAPSTYTTALADTQAGKNIFADWMDKLKKLAAEGITLPPLPTGTGAGSFPGLTGGTAGVDAAAAASQQLTTAYDDAKTKLERALKEGASYATDLADREAIRAAGQKLLDAGQLGTDALALEMDNSFDTIRAHFKEQSSATLTRAQNQLNWDEILGKPHAVLLADVNRVTAAMTAEGDPAAQIAATRKQMLDSIAKAPGGGKDSVGAAEDAFRLLLLQGPVTMAQGVKDINAIVAAQGALPPGQRPSDAQIQLTALGDMKELTGKLLEQGQKRLDIDVAHRASLAQLHADELALLAIARATPGLTPVDIAQLKDQWDKAIGDLPKPPHVDAYKQAAFDLARSAGYGQTTVTMGPVRDTLVAHLQAQLRLLEAQNTKQEKQITLLEAELVEQKRGSGLLEGIFQNTAGTHEATQRTARHTQPRPTSGAHGFSQRTGVPIPV